MPSIETLTRGILAQEGKSPDKPITFHMTPFVPVKGIKGGKMRYLVVGRSGPSGPEMLPPGIYGETNIPPAQFNASLDGIRRAIRIIGAIAKHINAQFAEPKQEPRTAKQIREDRENRRRLVMACRYPSSYSPLGYLMFKLVPAETTKD